MFCNADARADECPNLKNNWQCAFAYCQLLPVRETPINSARADSEIFCFLRKFGKPRNTVCISDFPNCTEGAKDPLLSRRRFIQRFLSCEGMTKAISDASEAIKTVRCDDENGELELPQQHPFLPIAVSATDYPPRSSRQGRGRSRGISFMLIGITQPSGKLVFVASLQVSCHCETSAHTGRGNPPVERNQVTITTKNRRNPRFWVLIGTFPI